MVYKKFIKKNGKTYGPYHYHSERVGGKVVSKYLGPKENKNNFVWTFVGITAAVLLLYFVAVYFNGGSLTGNVVLNANTVLLSDGSLTGEVKVSLKEGELIPANSKVVITNSSGDVREFFLKDVVSEDAVEGDFFIVGKSVSGNGEGYGVYGTKSVYPSVYFTLSVSNLETTTPGEDVSDDETSEGNETIEEVSESNETIEEEVEDEIVVEEEVVEEGVEESGNSTITGNVISGLLNSVSNFFLGFSPTGNVALEVGQEVSGSVTGDSSYTYTLSEGQTASIVPGSVRTDESQIDDSYVKLSLSGTELTVTTTYSESVEGFGSDYVNNGVGEELIIDLSGLGISTDEGNLEIKVVYEDEILISISDVIEFGNNILTNSTQELNETILDEAIIQEIQFKLSESERQILLDEFGNSTVDVVKSEIVNGRLIVRYSLVKYWAEFSYDESDLDDERIELRMSNDRVKWLKDIAKSLSVETSEPEEFEFVGNFSI